MRRPIAESRALVTGASAGIGRAISLELTRQGGNVLAVARREDRLRELADESRSLGHAIEWHAGDITDAAVRNAAVNRAVERFGGLDILVNNAGIGALGWFADATDDRLRRIFEVNLFALAAMTRVALLALKRGNRPIVVNVSSILGHVAVPRSSEYCASKYAVQGLSRSLRTEFAPLGIDLLVVCPGTTESEFFDNVIENSSSPRWSGRRGMPAAEVARQTVRAIRRGRRELSVGPMSKLMYFLNRLSPRLVDWAVRRIG